MKKLLVLSMLFVHSQVSAETPDDRARAAIAACKNHEMLTVATTSQPQRVVVMAPRQMGHSAGSCGAGGCGSQGMHGGMMVARGYNGGMMMGRSGMMMARPAGGMMMGRSMGGYSGGSMMMRSGGMSMGRMGGGMMMRSGGGARAGGCAS